MSSIKVDAEIWDEIVKHYMTIKEPTPADRRVIGFIIDKENRRMAREDFKEAQARHARLRDWSAPSGG